MSNVKISKCPNVKMPKCQNVKMPKCQNVKMSKCQNVKMPKCQNVKMSKCQISQNVDFSKFRFYIIWVGGMCQRRQYLNLPALIVALYVFTSDSRPWPFISANNLKCTFRHLPALIVALYVFTSASADCRVVCVHVCQR